MRIGAPPPCERGQRGYFLWERLTEPLCRLPGTSRMCELMHSSKCLGRVTNYLDVLSRSRKLHGVNGSFLHSQCGSRQQAILICTVNTVQCEILETPPQQFSVISRTRADRISQQVMSGFDPAILVPTCALSFPYSINELI